MGEGTTKKEEAKVWLKRRKMKQGLEKGVRSKKGGIKGRREERDGRKRENDKVTEREKRRK